MSPASLEARLKETIRRRGPIPFAEFMRAALYDPAEGYYTAGGVHIGPEGDFYTAPATHPVFGALLALQLERFWDLLGRPQRLVVLEGGGAKGLLARDILSYTAYLEPRFRQSLDYWILELGRLGKVREVERGLDVAWEETAALPDLETAVFLSNELFDALPVHRVVRQGGQLYELYVDLAGDDLIEVPDAPSTPALEEHFHSVGVELPEGCRAEVNLEAPRLLARIARALGRGFALTIDYGYPAEALYSVARRQGTLLCYHRHISSTNPYIRIGKQDLTAHVDFTALAQAGEQAGLRTEGLLTQQRYLKRLGIQSFLDRLRETPLAPQEHAANQMAILELTRATDFGRFGVLLQSKGPGAPWGLDQLSGSRARQGLGPLPLPLLTPEHMPLLEGRYPHYQALDLGPTL